MNNLKKYDAATGRNSSVEMLRIVAMMMIVISHASVHGGYPERNSVVEFNNHFLNWAILGNLGTNIYVLITGYFLCTKQFDVKWVLKPLTQVWFYSVLCGLIQLVVEGSVSGKEIIAILFPTIFQKYWFFTAYFVLMLLAPYINILINNASQKQFQTCLLTMIVLWCVILSFTNQDMLSSEMIRMFMYYMIGAYFKMYPDNYLAVSGIRNWLASVSMLLLFLSSTTIRFVNEHVVYLISETSFINEFSVITVGASVGLFLIAAYHAHWENSFVNTIASCTFGVYLLHDNPFMRKVIWRNWLDNTVWYDSGWLMFYILLSVLLVFAACLPIELLRQKIVAKPLLRYTEKILGWIRKRIEDVAGCVRSPF